MPRTLAIWTPDREAVATVLDELAPEAALPTPDGPLPVRILEARDSATNLQSIDAAALLLRYVDLRSLSAAHAMVQAFSGDASSLVIMVCREPKEKDFKMSCPLCGQKLWVRDSDVDRRGRCPNCRKAFGIPTQVGLIRERLHLAADIPILEVTSGSVGPAVEALHRILDLQTLEDDTFDLDREGIMNRTAVIEIPDDL